MGNDDGNDDADNRVTSVRAKVPSITPMEEKTSASERAVLRTARMKPSQCRAAAHFHGFRPAP